MPGNFIKMKKLVELTCKLLLNTTLSSELFVLLKRLQFKYDADVTLNAIETNSQCKLIPEDDIATCWII